MFLLVFDLDEEDRRRFGVVAEFLASRVVCFQFSVHTHYNNSPKSLLQPQSTSDPPHFGLSFGGMNGCCRISYDNDQGQPDPDVEDSELDLVRIRGVGSWWSETPDFGVFRTQEDKDNMFPCV